MTRYLAVDFEQGVNDAWSNVVEFVPKFVAFLVILIIGYIVAKVIERILDKILERVGFDRLVERGGVKKALQKSQYDASGILGKIVFYAIMLVVLSMAFGVFGDNPISTYLDAAVAYLPKVFIAVVIVVITAAIATAVRGLVTDTLGGMSYGTVLANVAAVAIWAVGSFAALDQLEIAPTVVTGLLYAVLAIVVGVTVVAVGGGGIAPMRERWEQTLRRYDQEKQQVRVAVGGEGAPPAGGRGAGDTAAQPPILHGSDQRAGDERTERPGSTGLGSTPSGQAPGSSTPPAEPM
jgi:hypothetical protein